MSERVTEKCRSKFYGFCVHMRIIAVDALHRNIFDFLEVVHVNRIRQWSHVTIPVYLYCVQPQLASRSSCRNCVAVHLKFNRWMSKIQSLPRQRA